MRSNIDTMMKMDRDLNSQLRRLFDVLERYDYTYKAGYLESFISFLAVDLQLNKKQMQLFTDLVTRRVSDRMRSQAPSLVD
jgi:hypothetical protein